MKSTLSEALAAVVVDVAPTGQQSITIRTSVPPPTPRRSRSSLNSV